MARLWARAGVYFTVDDDELKKLQSLISGGNCGAAREILKASMLRTCEFAGDNYIPDNDDCISGVDELRDFDF